MESGSPLTCHQLVGRQYRSSPVYPQVSVCRRLQVADVEWSERLEKKAKDWANELAENNKFKHSPSSDENLYMSSGFQPTEYCTTAVTRMYESEEKRYNYSRPGWAAKYGHFTMVSGSCPTTSRPSCQDEHLSTPG